MPLRKIDHPRDPRLDAADSYRLLFEKNPQPIWVFDDETLEFLAVNEAALRLYGYNREEFLRLTLRDMRPAAELPGLLEFKSQLTLSLMEFGAPTHWKHRKKDGTIIDVECKGATIQFAGRAASLIIIDDITESKKQSEHWREAAENFEVLFECVHDGLAIHEEGRMLACNDAMARMFGSSREGCVGKSFFDFAAPESRYQMLSHLTTGGSGPLECSLRRPDGARLRVTLVSRRIRYGSRPANLLIVRDVSDRALRNGMQLHDSFSF